MRAEMDAAVSYIMIMILFLHTGIFVQLGNAPSVRQFGRASLVFRGARKT